MRESESERHSGEQKSGEKEKRKNSERGRESVFILMCTQSEGSVSAIVPGLPVKTVRLPQRLFISTPLRNARSHKPILTHSRRHVQMHKEPPKAFNNALIKALATTQQQHQQPFETCVTAPPPSTVI